MGHDMSQLQRKRENWGTRFGVILAVMGSAVGLGNFLRFPGLAAQYEGGAFMIPYFIAFFVLGLPIALAEWAMGRYGGARGFNSPPGIFRAIWPSRLAPYVGALSAAVPVLIYMYYIHLEAWCLGYAWKYLVGDPVLLNQQVLLVSGQTLAEATNTPEAIAAGKALLTAGTAAGTGGGDAITVVQPNNLVLFFGGALGDMTQLRWLLQTATPFVVVAFVINFILIYRGVTRGIEWFSKLAMPALILCALVILARVLTLSPVTLADGSTRSVLDGLGYMWNPTHSNGSLWKSLQNAQMWIDATGQIFFSLSVGFGLIVTYASYVRRDDDIALSAVTSASGNEFCEVALAGMIVVPAAFLFIGPDRLTATEGSGLKIGFMALPDVFAAMPMGRWVGFLFFFLLFFAAVTSSLSMLQPAIAMLEEGLGLGRKASVTMLGFITAVGAGFVGLLSGGLDVLDTFDFWMGSFALYVLATIMVIIFGWVLGLERGAAEIDRGAEIRIPRLVLFLLKYVAPVYLVTLFSAWVWQYVVLPPQAGKPNKLTLAFGSTWDATWRIKLALAFIALVIVLFLLLANQCARRWDRNDPQSEVVP